MAKRIYPGARVRLYEPGRQYTQQFDGFGRYEVVGDLWRSGRLQCNTVSSEALGLGAGLGSHSEASAAMLLDHRELNLAVCRPFLDSTQSVGLDQFDLCGGHWQALEGLGIGREVRLYQSDGNTEVATGAVSRFTLPRNPVICVGLQRVAPRTGHSWASQPPSTEVHLGVGSAKEWSLVIPYGGPAFLRRRRNGVWESVPGQGHGRKVGNLEGNAPGQRVLLWLAVWRGKLVVSTDGFAEDLWVCSGGGEPVEVPEGRISVWHNAGQWAFSVLPVKMVSAVLDSFPLEAGYDTLVSAGDLFVEARQEPVRKDDGTVLAQTRVEDNTELRADLGPTERSWRATLEPYVHQPEGQTVRTCVSPELHSVQIGQQADILEPGTTACSDVTDDVVTVTGEVGGDGRASLYEVRLDNAQGRYAGLSEYRRCEVELGWTLEDGSAEYTPVVDGHAVEPSPSVTQSLEQRLEAVIIDGMVRLRDEKCDGRAPVFDGWPVVDVVAWVLGRCGIPTSAQDLEDTGTRLSSGPFDQPRWRVETGRAWSEFLAEVVEFDHLGVLFQDVDGKFRKTCRYCRQKRTAQDVARHDGTVYGACDSTVKWELHTRDGVSDLEGTQGAILSIERAQRSLHGEDYANYVAVCGVSASGEPVQAAVLEPGSVSDPTSDHFVGWRKMSVSALATHTTQAEANRLALSLYAERAERPEGVRIVIPLEPGMRIGDVVRVRGAESIGADGRKYRVEALRHVVHRGRNRLATTEIRARWLREESQV
jgi:hypothetical protein